jgi:hypothetical protein
MYKTALQQNVRTTQLILIQHAVLVIIFMSLYMSTVVKFLLWMKIDLIEIVLIKLEMLDEEEGEAVLLFILKCVVVILSLLNCSVMSMSIVRYIYN